MQIWADGRGGLASTPDIVSAIKIIDVARVDKNTDDEETSQPDEAAAFATCKHEASNSAWSPAASLRVDFYTYGENLIDAT